MSYKTILTEVDGKVATITLNRPEALNALNGQLMEELGEALLAFDVDDNIGCMILTGSEKAFAAGADNAKFAQPEVKLGIIPGAGGTQRLPRAVSKAKAMDLALTGRMMDAAEAERSGLVARVFPQADLLQAVKALAKGIADMPLLKAMMVKESINTAYETTLAEGIHFERRLFHACFGTNDQKEGMATCMEKRPAKFTNA
ncbi:enoyl-CoA hydratase-related protein [Polynucleobacter necessarius]|uniref:enoyl-CoA hydratase-related protein n=1 Tax=Polynucleobacter necessarius TaxID=576610 RepID=UPI000E09626C|nr:enoyl-CoA hydratase-related protein [Polynucleobacter necessarius]HAT38897.1 enoyl-CoA hydratase [Polynucleobacter sp.]